MQVIIPAGGRGTRLRPLSEGVPKALAPLAESTLLDHALDALPATGIERITVVGGADSSAIQAALAARADERLRLAVQAEPLGQAHAVLQAAPGARDGLPALVLFVDTLHDIDLAALAERCGDADGLLFARPMSDASAFGVAVVDDEGFATRLVEKPRGPVSNLAVIGVYYLRDGARLMDVVRRSIARGPASTIRGEHYLLDALQMLIDEGARLRVATAGLWLDCGTPAALAAAGRHLLELVGHDVAPGVVDQHSVLRPPVRIAAGARIVESVVGPHVAIAAEARIERSVVGPLVGVGAAAHIQQARVSNSLLAAHASVRGSAVRDSILAAHAGVHAYATALFLGPHQQLGDSGCGGS